jgi:hypothetical protein
MPRNVIPATHFEVNPEKTHATLKIGAETLVVDAESLQNFIAHLGALRQQLDPAVPKEFPANGQFLQVFNTILEVRFPEDRKTAALILRTPNYGWIGFHLHPLDATGAARYLLANLEPRDPATA